MSTLLQEYQADSADVAAIVGGYHGAPHQILGPHNGVVAGQPGVAIRTFRPLDQQIFVYMPANDQRTPMVQPAFLKHLSPALMNNCSIA
jgi:1,4-alpha-glucan branching enzyme